MAFSIRSEYCTASFPGCMFSKITSNRLLVRSHRNHTCDMACFYTHCVKAGFQHISTKMETRQNRQKDHVLIPSFLEPAVYAKNNSFNRTDVLCTWIVIELGKYVPNFIYFIRYIKFAFWSYLGHTMVIQRANTSPFQGITLAFLRFSKGRNSQFLSWPLFKIPFMYHKTMD